MHSQLKTRIQVLELGPRDQSLISPHLSWSALVCPVLVLSRLKSKALEVIYIYYTGGWADGQTNGRWRSKLELPPGGPGHGPKNELKDWCLELFTPDAFH